MLENAVNLVWWNELSVAALMARLSAFTLSGFLSATRKCTWWISRWRFGRVCGICPHLLFKCRESLLQRADLSGQSLDLPNQRHNQLPGRLRSRIPHVLWEENLLRDQIASHH
jgi:hypothetical protein